MYRRMGKLTSLICCLCILSQMTGCAGSSPSMVTKNGIYFDTAITITLAADNARAGEEILNGCMELCQKLEGIFSRTLEGSELYQVNHRDSSTVTVSKELAAVIGCGLEYYRLSEGKLDITIAPVLELWDFKNGMDRLPGQEELDAALERVDASAVHLSGNQVVFDRPDTEIDLGALVKGYAADELKAYLRKRGVSQAVINLGGNVNTLGSRPGGTGWRVGIQKPFADRGVTGQILEVTDRSVVSSGTYERYFERYYRLDQTARSFGVMLAQENVSRCRGRSLEFLVRMKAALGENVVFALDFKQARRSGTDYHDLFSQLGGSIRHLHVSDYAEGRDCLPVGEGNMDFRAFLKELAGYGYQGTMILELYRQNYGEYEDLLRSYRFMKREAAEQGAC